MPQLKMTLQEVEKAILWLGKDEQQKLAADLSKLLQLSDDDISLLTIAEPAFKFWNNDEDAVYDSL